MNRISCAVFASLLLLSACSSDASTAPAATPSKLAATAPAKPVATPPAAPVETHKPPAESPKPPAESPKPSETVDMNAAIQELMAKPEQPDEQIEIQHVLISFKGAPRMPASVTRSKEEAQTLAEQVYAEAIGGADFDELVKQYTNDRPPGIYPMTKATRKGMVKGFGDVGFRLKVGEIGVSPWDTAASPYGWHIIKRLK